MFKFLLYINSYGKKIASRQKKVFKPPNILYNMLKVYKRRLIIGMIVLMIVFGLFFAAAVSALSRNIPVLGIGIPVVLEDYLVMLLSIGGVGMSFVEILKVEHSKA